MSASEQVCPCRLKCNSSQCWVRLQASSSAFTAREDRFAYADTTLQEDVESLTPARQYSTGRKNDGALIAYLHPHKMCQAPCVRPQYA